MTHDLADGSLQPYQDVEECGLMPKGGRLPATYLYHLGFPGALVVCVGSCLFLASSKQPAGLGNSSQHLSTRTLLLT